MGRLVSYSRELLVKTSNMKPLTSASVDVRLWELGEYLGCDTQIPSLIDLDWIHSQLAMATVAIGTSRQKVWATIDLAKVSFHKNIA
jgi:hypothetical protein